MNKAISIKNRSLLFVFLVNSLISCTSTIRDSELVLLSGRYYSKMDSTLFSGEVISRFSSGEVEGEKTFKKGIITSSEAFGYEGEIIGASVYEMIEIENSLSENVERVMFVSSNEGEVWYYSIQVIVKEELTERSEYKSLQTQIMKESKISGYLKKVRDNSLTFEVLKGELEHPLFETRVN